MLFYSLYKSKQQQQKTTTTKKKKNYLKIFLYTSVLRNIAVAVEEEKDYMYLEGTDLTDHLVTWNIFGDTLKKKNKILKHSLSFSPSPHPPKKKKDC